MRAAEQQVAYWPGVIGVQLRTTVPLKLFCGVSGEGVGGGVAALDGGAGGGGCRWTVRVKLPLGTPVPVSGMVMGELVSELVMVRVPVRVPRAVGVKVTVTVQLAPAARVVEAQGVVTA